MTPAEFLTTCETLNLTPTNVHVEWPFTDQDNPRIAVWMRTRTDFEAITDHLRLKTADSGAHAVGQRKFWTTTPGPLLIQAVSFEHHADYVEAGAR